MASNWLQGFSDAEALSVRESLSLISCRDDAQQRVVLAPHEGKGLDVDRFVMVHQALSHSAIPTIEPRDDIVVLKCAAVTDLRQLLRTARGDRLHASHATALMEEIYEPVIAAHKAGHPSGGGPVTLGAASFQNVLVTSEGDLSLIGFEDTLTSTPGETVMGVYRDQSVAMGGRGTPGTDSLILYQLFRTLDRRIDLPPALARIARKQPLPEDQTLTQLVGDLRRRVLSDNPPTALVVLQHHRAIWREAGVKPDHEGLRAWLTERVAAACRQRAPSPVLPKVTAIGLGPCSINLNQGTITRDNALVQVTDTEWKLLRYMLRQEGRVIPKSELQEQVWGYSAKAQSRAVDATWQRLKGKIEVDPANPTHLLAVWGRGLQIVGAEPEPE
jgi:hypothetical protein